MRGNRGAQQKVKEPEKKVKNEQQKIKNELTEEQKREIKEAFSSFEDSGILPEELKSAMYALGFDQKNQEIQKIFDKMEGQKGPLNYNQFLDVMLDNEEEKDPQNELLKAFKVLCEEGTEKITFKSLSKICGDLGEKINEEELQEMINEADKDQDDEVGEEDFFKMMQKTGMF